MCGIAGIWCASPSQLEEVEIGRMVQDLRHRGPNDSGVLRKEGMFLGHTRLSILDLTSDGHQPMSNETGSIWIVFNGEIYNYLELRAELEAKGHRFQSKTDTEVLVHLYEEKGEAMIEEIQGMFSFAIWDIPRQKCFLARDRFGEKPLFYSESGGRFSFASEVGTLARLPWVGRGKDEAALSLYFQLHYVPAPRTAFAQVRRLPSGCVAVWRAGRLEVSRYYPKPVEPFAGDFEEASSRFNELFTRSVRRCLVSDVPVGLALSAGLDSSAIAAVAAQYGPIQTMTIDFEPARSTRSEAVIAAESAEKLGLPHLRLRPTLGLTSRIRSLVQDLGEPFCDASVLPSAALFEAFSKECKVILGGDGGDELLGGYSKYVQWERLQAMSLAGRMGVGPLVGKVAGSFYGRSWVMKSHLKHALCGARLLQGAFFNRRLGRLTLTETEPDLDGLFRPEVKWWNDSGPLEALEDELSNVAGEALTRRLMMEKESLDNLGDQMLRKVDIASMRYSVEARSPFLDHHLADLVCSLPDHFLWQGRRSKLLLRSNYRKLLPGSIWNRPKSGFGYPLREQINRELAVIRGQLLGVPSLQQWFRKEGIERILNQHSMGQPWHTTLILKMLFLAAWCEIFDPS